jgi:hypothetical protein
MSQRNQQTNFKRAVRRFQALGAPAPQRIWSWETDDGGYWPCDADVSEFLSLVQGKGWRTARFWADRCGRDAVGMGRCDVVCLIDRLSVTQSIDQSFN